jgi:hypothetical protein
MSLEVKDATGTSKYLETGSGDGSSGTPFISPVADRLGAKADSSATTDTGTFSLIALIKRLLSVTFAKGQTTKSASIPVTLASDQDTLAAKLISATSGSGLSQSKTISAASTNATSVKGSAGQVYSIQAFNIGAAVAYLKLYNKASAPTVGTDTPVKVLMIPAASSPVGSGFIYTQVLGLEFATGIAFAITGGIADSNTTAIAANEVVINLDYK